MRGGRGGKFRLAPFLLLVLLLSGCPSTNPHVIRVAGEIEARDTTAGSRIGGRVIQVLADEGDTVSAGDLLIQLDDAEAQATMAVAAAQLSAREAALAKLVAGATTEQRQQAEALADGAAAQLAMALKGARDEEIRAVAATMAAAEAQRDVARKEFDRIANLRAQDVASQRQFDQAQAALDAATAQFDSAREQRDLVVRGTREEEIAMARANHDHAQAALAEVRRGAREEDIVTAEAARDGALAELDRARVALREMTIVAPQAGIVESLDVRPGTLIRPGPVVRIVDPEDLEVVIYVSARMLGYLQIQQKIDFTADAFGDAQFTGHVRQIASEGEFTPRNLQTEEERAQQVFGVTVGLDAHGGKLRPGMSVTAHLPVPSGGT